MLKDNTIDLTINHLFRQESGKMVAVLIRIFGTEHLELAEDVVQDALVSALETWKFKGLPKHPKAWLYQTAKNKAIDVIRKSRHHEIFDFSDPNRQLLQSEYTLSQTMDNFWQDDHIQDDFLAMMFACCNPDLTRENQITFILKSLCGFSTKEIARAFLTSEHTVSKRLYRTKEYFRKQKAHPKMPPPSQIESRTDTVLSAIYLLFNEGYSSTHTNELIRKELIAQALFLGRSLINNKKTRLPQVYAFMALVCFHSARINGRLSSLGEPILLADQDRRLWDYELIILGDHYLTQAAYGNRLTAYHLEAAIAYEHCIAKTYGETNWKTILSHYDMLLTMRYDPIVFLNRCIVLMELKGAKAALEATQKLHKSRKLTEYYLYHVVLGTILERLKRNKKAAEHYKKAMTLTRSDHEVTFLMKKVSIMNAL